ncbi:MAG: hypothetical protein BWY43_00521 [candidate division WS2 bacterium ADurb.Bin280]|uniref:Uncharacterized protein n=1 Tax=candidate division WS2 bacterium ADurb.Bin280 TaxID=1852829 RepID=A0A1V5SDR1_9BACT|nr:MAG: hypothetical protein BWY43_00521 [candidate division WS2 bacterium ADurb.Bin280]
MSEVIAELIPMLVRTGILLLIIMAPFKWEKELSGLWSQVVKYGKIAAVTQVATIGAGIAVGSRNIIERRKAARNFEFKKLTSQSGEELNKSIDSLAQARVRRTAKDPDEAKRVDFDTAKAEISQEIQDGNKSDIIKDIAYDSPAGKPKKGFNANFAMGRLGSFAFPDRYLDRILTGTSTVMFLTQALKNRSEFKKNIAKSTFGKFAETGLAEGAPAKIDRRIQGQYEDIRTFDSISDVADYDPENLKVLRGIYARLMGLPYNEDESLMTTDQLVAVTSGLIEHLKDPILGGKDARAYDNDPVLIAFQEYHRNKPNGPTDGYNEIGAMIAVHKKIMELAPRELSRYARGEKLGEEDRRRFMSASMLGQLGKVGYQPTDFKTKDRGSGDEGDEEPPPGTSPTGPSRPPTPTPPPPPESSSSPDYLELVKAVSAVESKVESSGDRAKDGLEKIGGLIAHFGENPPKNIDAQAVAQTNRRILTQLKDRGKETVADQIESEGQSLDVESLPEEDRGVAEEYLRNQRIATALSVNETNPIAISIAQNILTKPGEDLPNKLNQLQSSLDALTKTRDGGDAFRGPIIQAIKDITGTTATSERDIIFNTQSAIEALRNINPKE